MIPLEYKKKLLNQNDSVICYTPLSVWLNLIVILYYVWWVNLNLFLFFYHFVICYTFSAFLCLFNTRLILRNRTNAVAEVTVVAVLRENVTAIEVKVVTVVRVWGVERTWPIVTVWTSVVNSRTISVTASRNQLSSNKIIKRTFRYMSHL